MKRILGSIRKLSVQLVIITIALVIITTFAVGLPAILLINNQLNTQSLAQIEQGWQTSSALMDARLRYLKDLSTLTAQRPTLIKSAARQEFETLPGYLQTLRTGADLDLLVVCNAEGKLIAQSSAGRPVRSCPATTKSEFTLLGDGTGAGQVLLTSSEIRDNGVMVGRVVVGIQLDDDVAREMRAQSGLEHTFLVNARPVASSFDISLIQLEDTYLDAGQDGQTPAEQQVLVIDGDNYYIARYPVSDSLFDIEIALSIQRVVETRQRVVLGLLGGMVLIMLFGSLVGVTVARRIGGAFQNLSSAAESIEEGDLDTPVKVESTVDEAEDVARVLENARIELRRTLTEVRNEKAWNDQLLESIVEGIVALDRGNHITFFSAGAERITGWNSAQVIGRNCDDLLRPVEIGQPFSTVMPKPGQRKRLVIEVAQGRQFTLAVTGARFAPSMAQESERVFVFRDVSDEEAVHRLLGDFMANVSHEFRTPLSALAASIELLLDQADDLSKSELMELINALHLSILSLGTLVDNLIEGASIETGHFHVSPRRADVGDIIGDAVRVMQPLLDKYHQQLDVELPADIPVVWADPKRATQILVNLLSNASKYSPDHTKISIRVHSRGDWIRVEVADQGPGILPQYRQDIFHRFSSIAPEESEARYGIGLGLSVVKAIAQAHGGQAGVEENDGGGSVFWFTLSRADSK